MDLSRRRLGARGDSYLGWFRRVVSDDVDSHPLVRVGDIEPSARWPNTARTSTLQCPLLALSGHSARGEGGPFLPLKQTLLGPRCEFRLLPQSSKAEAANQGGCGSPQPPTVDSLKAPLRGVFFSRPCRKIPGFRPSRHRGGLKPLAGVVEDAIPLDRLGIGDTSAASSRIEGSFKASSSCWTFSA